MDDTRLQQGKQWLEQLLKLAALSVPVKADLAGTQALDESCWLTIDHTALTPEQIEILTGTDGAVIDSIQYLVNTILNLGQAEDQRRAYTVELNEYRIRRQTELQKMAEQAVSHVRETGDEYEMKDLSSAERRQVHTILKAFEDLETYSRGQEPDRRLVVRRLQA
ncbi:RNA-binding protein [Oscillatoria sp. FACHB-1407]|uniref:Jag family protein n=1 Tax=Oscillatoria sp. FACHB-1407 TaxID=2692847 RepID=UPI0016881DC3|nr:R3H domain-containing nucleic acid-binding protein [Oscillatoria sp. FACHB-1407]MBD2462412.1 RNA-binding protein [Oscillatoria sp. FACHB-1407]